MPLKRCLLESLIVCSGVMKLRIASLALEGYLWHLQDDPFVSQPSCVCLFCCGDACQHPSTFIHVSALALKCFCSVGCPVTWKTRLVLRKHSTCWMEHGASRSTASSWRKSKYPQFAVTGHQRQSVLGTGGGSAQENKAEVTYVYLRIKREAYLQIITAPAPFHHGAITYWCFTYRHTWRCGKLHPTLQVFIFFSSVFCYTKNYVVLTEQFCVSYLFLQTFDILLHNCYCGVQTAVDENWLERPENSTSAKIPEVNSSIFCSLIQIFLLFLCFHFHPCSILISAGDIETAAEHLTRIKSILIIY